MNDQLTKLDERTIPHKPGEFRAVAVIRNEFQRLPFFLEFNRNAGIDRFFFIDNGSNDGSQDYILEQPDCHLFHCNGNFFVSNIQPPLWGNALRNTFCDGYWCLSLDADELFVYPHCESLALPRLCAYLDRNGYDAVATLMIDMYGEEPLKKATYMRGSSFIEACPYFDRELGHERYVRGGYPSVLTFSRARGRVFWTGEKRGQLPPCITKVPLVKWRRGIGYKASQHVLNHAKLADIQGGLLHFKFFPTFYSYSATSVSANKHLQDQTIAEYRAYVQSMDKNPDLTMYNENSERYRNSRQLIDLGWLKTSANFDAYAQQDDAQEREPMRAIGIR